MINYDLFFQNYEFLLKRSCRRNITLQKQEDSDNKSIICD